MKAQIRVPSGPKTMSILQELDDAISKGTPESRLKALWHATDMLLMGGYTESEIWIFGEVIGRLSERIELAARSQLAWWWLAAIKRRSAWSTSSLSTIP